MIGNFKYTINQPVAVDEFMSVLMASTLGERRPVQDPKCIKGMLENADLMVAARLDGKLVGVARSVTDFHYCCYLSDLAVDKACQKEGIGRELIGITRQQLGPRCTLILLSAPAAVDYYPKIGFEKHDQAWVLKPGTNLQ